MLFHIWPLMLLVTLAKLVILTCAAGLLGPYIFLAVALLFFINFALLYKFCKKTLMEGSSVHKSCEDLAEVISLQPNNEGSVQKLRIDEDEDDVKEKLKGFKNDAIVTVDKDSQDKTNNLVIALCARFSD